MSYLSSAQKLRAAINGAGAMLTDEQALTVPIIFPAWCGDGISYAAGDRVMYGGVLYKCLQAHTSQGDWTPDAAPALYTVIDVSHAGTQDEPIPAERGMEYVYGLYYLDSEDGKLYLCQRTGEAAGGTVVLQYLPHELVGNYFVEVI